MGLAVQADDPQVVFAHGFYNALPNCKSSYEDFLKLTWEPSKLKGGQGLISGSERVMNSERILDYFAQAQIVCLLEERKLPEGEAHFWLSHWKEAKLLRREFFLLCKGEQEWRWAVGNGF